SYVPAPQSIFRDISRLRPGHAVTVDERGEWREQIFFDATAAASSPSPRESDGRILDEAVENLHDAIADAVRCHTVSDVPIGTFLSGGIDSTLVTCLMQSTSARPVRTFSAGFEDEDFNEAEKAREIAKHLGTDHHEV